jgi:hypothetical protein
MKVFPFPAAPVSVRSVSDIAYDSTTQSFWLLAETSSSPLNTPTSLVQISAVTGNYIGRLDAVSWPFEIVNGSTLVYDRSSFWITSSVVSVPRVFQVASNGVYIGNFINCPATSSGICVGLGFDAATSSYWTAGSDNTSLVNYQLASANIIGSAVPYASSLFAGASDVAFAAAAGEVFVVKGGITRVNRVGAVLGTIPFTVPGNGRGDWDGIYFWVVDNSSKSLKALFVR